MKETRLIMGMPIAIEVAAPVKAGPLQDIASAAEQVFEYLRDVDERFSTYKDTSEISMINRGEIDDSQWSSEMREVFAIAERTKQETHGYFDARRPDGSLDPSGIVKGWALYNAAALLTSLGYADFLIDGSGDIASHGNNSDGALWKVGIRHPFKSDEIVKVVYPNGRGVATSGSYIRGAHIYDPHDHTRSLDEVVSITVIGPDVLEADRFATAAFAMQRDGITFIEQLPGFEAYMIDKNGIATMTSGFEHFTTV